MMLVTKKRIIALFGALSLAMAAPAQNQTPTSNPSEVMVKGRLVQHSWRNGRIYVPTSELQPLLNMTDEMPDMDLLKALEKKGGYLWSVKGNRFEAKPDPLLYSQAPSSPIGGQVQQADYMLAEQRMQKAFLKYPRLTSHPGLARVEKIGQQIVAVSDLPKLKWNFFVIHAVEPNAFCTGAGWVAVTDSLLALKLSDNELGGVMAHEIGHGCRKDLEETKFNTEQMARYGNEANRLDRERQVLLLKREQLLEKAQRYMDLSRRSISGSEAASYQDQANSLASQAKELERPIRKLDNAIAANVKNYKGKEALVTESVFAQKDEYDADVTGLYYATKAGFSSTGLMDALKKLTQANAEKFGQAAFQGGFSHPPVGKRLETMNKVLSDWRSQR